MKSGVHSGQAIDLSIKPHVGHEQDFSQQRPHTVVLPKPEPRPAWSILWYQSIWPKCSTMVHNGLCLQAKTPAVLPEHSPPPSTKRGNEDGDEGKLGNSDNGNDLIEEVHGVDLSLRKEELEIKMRDSAITDVATCDGPVHFQRISNPNFALTVEHHERSSSGGTSLSHLPITTTPPSKTYLCIYCNQSFKSLFCYQKHKKRHLNPVSVDITASPSFDLTHTLSENTIRTGADLNVQFFPCKKCGSKFPSYYFVHKHKRVCDMGREGEAEVDPVHPAQ